MACANCGAGDADHVLTRGGNSEATLCADCVDAALRPLHGGQCSLCDRRGEFDLERGGITIEGLPADAFPGDDRHTVADRVVCETHFRALVDGDRPGPGDVPAVDGGDDLPDRR